MRHQRRKQIAEAVRMRNRNHTVIQIAPRDAHRTADVLGIGEQLLTAKADHTRGGRRAGSKF